jgi:hypothetical protein
MSETTPSDDRQRDNRANTDLLNAELPDVRFADDAYLRWLYDENPLGPAYQEAVDEDDVRMAHYALIPQDYRDANGPVPGCYSLNAVTRTGTQRKGYFVTIAKQVYEKAGNDGRRLATALPNEKSVGAGVKYLGWRLYGQMTIKLVVPTTLSTRGVDTYPVTESFLASADFEELTRDVDEYPTTGVTNSWTTEQLRWRLRRPHAHYSVHVSDEIFAVSSRTVQRGVPAAVLLKLLPRGRRRGPLSSKGIVAAACRHHRTPLALHGGTNEHVVIRGFEPPKRIRPAPLFMLVRQLDGTIDQDAVELTTYEFLDVDAF